MRKIDTIVVHCSFTPPSMDVGADVIRKWHIEERKWSDIGYHFVIKRNGEREKGREISKIGAHVAGHNSHSIGVCYVGGMNEDVADYAEDNRTAEQRLELLVLLGELKDKFPNAKIVGHRDLDNHKTCPAFDAKTEYSII